MGMTITEKIIAAHSGEKNVIPGQILTVNVDKVFTHDIFFTGVHNAFKEKNCNVWDPDKIIIVVDHELPASSIFSGDIYQSMVKFVQEQNIKNLYYGEGVCHQIIPEQGHVRPGEIFVGTDSHTVTYGALTALATGIGSTEMAEIWKTGKIWLKVPETIKFVFTGQLGKNVYSKDIILYLIGKMRSHGCVYNAVEFCGKPIEDLSMSERFTLTNMVVEMGAKNGIVPFDQKTKDYLIERNITDYTVYENDSDAVFKETFYIDASEILPQVSGPNGVDDVKSITEVEGMKIHQGYIGSCTNGRLEDLRVAANILKGKKIAPYIKLIVSPASQTVYKQAIKEGIIETFIDAGAVVTNPGCNLCYGTHGGVLGENEVAICSNNRNFPGRLGHKNSKVFLASPATVACSVLEGKIVDPRKYV